MSKILSFFLATFVMLSYAISAGILAELNSLFWIILAPLAAFVGWHHYTLYYAFERRTVE